MADELDYMSDEFIKNCENSENDVRPGLLKTRKEQRQHNLMKKKNLESEIMKKPNETEILEESLKQPINATNKGFSMLEKMGFKTGMGLGKNNSGIKEPIGINIRKDKVGLGHKSASLRKPEKKLENKLDKISEADFRAFISNRKREQMVSSDLRRSQRICKELDFKCERTSPKEPWFWVDEEVQTDDDNEEEEDDDDDDADDDSEEVKLSQLEKLEMLTKYLRQTYFYCIWCKIQYEDEDDMRDCPGPTRDDH